MNKVIKTKISYVFLALLFSTSYLFFAGHAFASGESIIIENPPENKQLTKKEVISIKGYALLEKKEIIQGQISFDGQVWRNLSIDNTSKDNFYHWKYDWTVAGKGKTFLQIMLKKKNGEIIEARRLIEIKKTPEDEKTQLQGMLKEYQDEQARLQKKKDEEKKVVQINPFLYTEGFLERTFGSFIQNRWMSLLPTPDQQTLFFEIILNINNFIEKYPAGKDILIFSSMPFIICTAAFLAIIAIGEDWLKIISILIAKFMRLFTNNKKDRKKLAWLFDKETFEPITWAKLIFIDDNNNVFVKYSDEYGRVYFGSLPDGEYRLELYKKGYKEYTPSDNLINNYRNYPVIKDKVQIIEGVNKFAIAGENMFHQDKAAVITRMGLLHSWKKWGVINIFSLTAIATLLSIFKSYYNNQVLTWELLSGIWLCYLSYRSFLRIKKPWGRIFDKNFNSIDLKRIILTRNNQIYTACRSDLEGRYAFGPIENNEYQIKSSNEKNTIMQGLNCYSGEKLILNDEKLCLLPINIVIE